MMKFRIYTITIVLTICTIIILLNGCEKENDDFIEDSGTFTDSRDRQIYKWVRIGDQIWMAENLKTTKFNDGTAIPLVTDSTDWSSLTTPGYCWYNNDETSYKNTYGALYNWYTVNTGKLCPTGWHVPTDEDWKELEIYLGMPQSEADGTGWRGTNEGEKLKEAGTTHWNNPNEGATNESGFTALPGGFYSYCGEFGYIGGHGYWWSSTDYDTDNACYRYVFYYYSVVGRSYCYKENGFSVRCVRD